MPQGLCKAPATFKRAMYNILDVLKMFSVLVYLENITVFSRTFHEYLAHLRLVFDCIFEADLNLKTLKCLLLKVR